MTRRTTEQLEREAEELLKNEAARLDELMRRRKSMAAILARRRPELFGPYLFGRAIVLKGVASVRPDGAAVRGFEAVSDVASLELIDQALAALLDEAS